MTRRMCLRFGILVLLGTLSLTCPGHAQSGGCVDSAALPRVPTPETRIRIIGVEFQGESPLSDTLRTQLTKEIQQQERWVTPEESDSTWVNDAVCPIRSALLNQGHFKASVEGTPYLVRALANENIYVLRVEIQSGKKYRLGKIRFTSASDTPLVFTEAVLRQQVPLQEDQLFDTSKIRDGLEAIGKLYGSKGYIDATPEPDTTIDDESSLIDILIRVDEQQHYSIGRIEFLGLNTKTGYEVKPPQKSGEVLNFTLWQSFFEDNKSHLPADASLQKNLEVRRNVKNATVDITFDFRPCQQAQPQGY